MNEFRMYLAELLLNLAFRISPNNKDGKRLKGIVSKYMLEALAEFQTKQFNT